MGQQQLLLLVLSAIIVGVSIVIGINMFTSSATTANQDAVLQDCLHITSRAQEWLRKPTSLGGGGGFFTNLDLQKLNIPATNANVSKAFELNVSPTLLNVLGTGTEGTPTKLTVHVFVSTAGLDSVIYTP